jgi:hypothetical protein
LQSIEESEGVVKSAGRFYFSALKSFSFASWAFSKASLNRLASVDDGLAYLEKIRM